MFNWHLPTKTHKQLEALCMSRPLAFSARALGTPQVTRVVAEKHPPRKEIDAIHT